MFGDPNFGPDAEKPPKSRGFWLQTLKSHRKINVFGSRPRALAHGPRALAHGLWAQREGICWLSATSGWLSVQGRRLVCFKGPWVTHSLGPRAAGGSPSLFPNLPCSLDPFPSRLNTSWFVGTADGVNNAEVVMMVGGYDGGFGARVG